MAFNDIAGMDWPNTTDYSTYGGSPPARLLSRSAIVIVSAPSPRGERYVPESINHFFEFGTYKEDIDLDKRINSWQKDNKIDLYKAEVRERELAWREKKQLQFKKLNLKYY